MTVWWRLCACLTVCVSPGSAIDPSLCDIACSVLPPHLPLRRTTRVPVTQHAAASDPRPRSSPSPASPPPSFSPPPSLPPSIFTRPALAYPPPNHLLHTALRSPLSFRLSPLCCLPVLLWAPCFRAPTAAVTNTAMVDDGPPVLHPPLSVPTRSPSTPRWTRHPACVFQVTV